jgi:REP element-mobilizing transposase RayT
MNKLPVRKPNRLKGYDYSRNGAYFVTICTKNREKLFGSVQPVGTTALGRPPTNHNNPQTVTLTELGKCVDETIRIAGNNDGVKIDKYVVMPNNIHLIIFI